MYVLYILTLWNVYVSVNDIESENLLPYIVMPPMLAVRYAVYLAYVLSEIGLFPIAEMTGHYFKWVFSVPAT